MKNQGYTTRMHPAKYVIGVFLVLVILIPVWAAFVMIVIEPESLTIQEQTMGNRMLWWVIGPTVLVAALFGTHWVKASKNNADKQQNSVSHQMQVAQTEQQKREYVLEVIGLGVTLDKYRQGKLWAALQTGNHAATIREQDPKKYDWTARDKNGTGGGRGGDSLENGAQFTPMYYGVPVFNAAPLTSIRSGATDQRGPCPDLPEERSFPAWRGTCLSSARAVSRSSLTASSKTSLPFSMPIRMCPMLF